MERTQGRKRRTNATKLTARLAAYSATAAAATLTVPTAEAAGGNVNSGLNFSGTSSLSFNLSNANADFQFGPLRGAILAEGSSVVNSTFGVPIAERHQQIQMVARYDQFAAESEVLTRLAPGDNLTNLAFFGDGFLVKRHKTYSGTHVVGSLKFGPMKSGGTGYFAFKANANAHTYYGWMRVKVTLDANDFPVAVNFEPNGDGYFGAYMSKDDPNWNPGTFTAGTAYAVPEPSAAALGGLALLALGAAGIREHRRRKAAGRV